MVHQWIKNRGLQSAAPMVSALIGTNNMVKLVHALTLMAVPRRRAKGYESFEVQSILVACLQLSHRREQFFISLKQLLPAHGRIPHRLGKNRAGNCFAQKVASAQKRTIESLPDRWGFDGLIVDKPGHRHDQRHNLPTTRRGG